MIAVLRFRAHRIVLGVEITGGFEGLQECARLSAPQKFSVPDNGLRRCFVGFANRPMLVPSLMPALLYSVENMLGSGLPSGVRLPVSRLSPLRQSIHAY